MKSACPRSLDCKLQSYISPACFPSQVLHIVVLQHSMTVLSHWAPHPGPPGIQGCSGTANYAFVVRFLHYTSHGPPWHWMQNHSKEWYKRDFKAFSWYLTAVHQNHQSERASKNKAKHKENPQTLSKVPLWQQSRAEEYYSHSSWSSGCGAAEASLGSIQICWGSTNGAKQTNLHSDFNQNSLEKPYPVSSEICKIAETTSKAMLQSTLKGHLCVVSSSRLTKNLQDALDVF